VYSQTAMSSHFASQQQQQQGGVHACELDPSQGGAYREEENNQDELTNTGTYDYDDDDANKKIHNASAYSKNKDKDPVLAGEKEDETVTMVNHPINDTTRSNSHTQNRAGTCTSSRTWSLVAPQNDWDVTLMKKKKKQYYERLLQESSGWIRELEDVKWKLQKASMHNTIMLDFMAMQGLDESPQETAAMAAMTREAPQSRNS
jgi:hypothetical protein